MQARTWMKHRIIHVLQKYVLNLAPGSFFREASQDSCQKLKETLSRSQLFYWLNTTEDKLSQGNVRIVTDIAVSSCKDQTG